MEEQKELLRRRVHFLGSVPMLRRLDQRELTALARELSPRSFAAGQAVVEWGEEGDEMYLIEQGAAVALVPADGALHGRRGAEVEVRRYEEGDFFGEAALLSQQRRAATVRCCEPTQALVLSSSTFLRLVGDVRGCMSEARQRLRAASYSFGHVDFNKLFRHYNRSNSGALDWGEFRAMVRKDGRMTQALMGERELRTLFCCVDRDGDGVVSEAEFIAFCGGDRGHSIEECKQKKTPAPVSVAVADGGRGSVAALTSAELARGQAFLAAVTMPWGLTGKELRSLARSLVPVRCQVGEAVITAGETGDALYIVESGALQARSGGGGSAHGPEIVLCEYGAGSCFGELALLTTQPWQASVCVAAAGNAGQRGGGEARLWKLNRCNFNGVVGDVGSCMQEIRRRFRASAFTIGRMDFAKLFQHYDRSNRGGLDLADFRSAVRRDGRITAAMATDRELSILFHMVDLDGNSILDRTEFFLFLGLTPQGRPVQEEWNDDAGERENSGVAATTTASGRRQRSSTSSSLRRSAVAGRATGRVSLQEAERRLDSARERAAYRQGAWRGGGSSTRVTIKRIGASAAAASEVATMSWGSAIIQSCENSGHAAVKRAPVLQETSPILVDPSGDGGDDSSDELRSAFARYGGTWSLMSHRMQQLALTEERERGLHHHHTPWRGGGACTTGTEASASGLRLSFVEPHTPPQASADSDSRGSDAIFASSVKEMMERVRRSQVLLEPTHSWTSPAPDLDRPSCDSRAQRFLAADMFSPLSAACDGAQHPHGPCQPSLLWQC
eukprot:COSAG01_NODE_289_length_19391_cov_119.323122_22_plen_786_part_00